MISGEIVIESPIFVFIFYIANALDCLNSNLS